MADDLSRRSRRSKKLLPVSSASTMRITSTDMMDNVMIMWVWFEDSKLKIRRVLLNATSQNDDTELVMLLMMFYDDFNRIFQAFCKLFLLLSKEIDVGWPLARVLIVEERKKHKHQGHVKSVLSLSARSRVTDVNLTD